MVQLGQHWPVAVFIVYIHDVVLLLFTFSPSFLCVCLVVGFSLSISIGASGSALLTFVCLINADIIVGVLIEYFSTAMLSFMCDSSVFSCSR